MRMIKTLGLAAALLLAGAAMAEVVIHVAPDGHDRNPGTAARPVQSLERAQALVRQHNAAQDVAVELADGRYQLKAPLRFGRADGGQNGRWVRWRAAPGAKPMLTSAITVSGFTVHDADRRIHVAATPKGLDTRQIWVNGTTAERPWIELAREDVRFGPTGLEITNPKFAYVGAITRPDRLEVRATGFFTDRVSPVERVDGARLTMRQPAWDNNSWGYDTITRPIFPDDSRLFLVGALEFIGKVNDWHARYHQWVIDPEAGRLYLRAALDEDIASLTVEVPTLETLVSISGTPAAPVERLAFHGLTFAHSSWMGPSRPTGYANQQSGSFLLETSPIRPANAWDSCGWGCVEFESMRQKWHQIPAAVQVAAAREIRFERNLFTQIGQIALGIGNDATANLSGQGLATSDILVSRNRFAVLGGGAIMAGGVRADAHHPSDPLLVNRALTIADNVVATVSQDYRDNAAILTTYVDGASILHNDISDAPYDAIAVGWGWGYNDAGGNPNYDENQKGYVHNVRYTTPTTLANTRIEGNRIHGVKLWFEDGGAIYNLSANPNAVIRRNHIFDISNRIGIYLDEGSKHFTVNENVVETGGKWLNINTAGRMFERRISTDNRAFGNWHTSMSTGGRWLARIGNDASGNHLVPTRDWPKEAQAVIAQAGPRPEQEPAGPRPE